MNECMNIRMYVSSGEYLTISSTILGPLFFHLSAALGLTEGKNSERVSAKGFRD
jgi:hypothetical protein